MAPQLRASTKQKTYKSLGVTSKDPFKQATAVYNYKVAAIRQFIRRRNKRRGKPTIGHFPRVCSATWPFELPENPPVEAETYNSNN